MKTTLYLFDYLYMLKKDFFLQEREKVIKVLNNMPDFYLEMKWDFESSVIPLLGKIAPSGEILKNLLFFTNLLFFLLIFNK